VSADTLVKEGWRWWYQKYAPGGSTLERRETEARAGRRGLWANRHPVAAVGVAYEAATDGASAGHSVSQ